MRLIASVVPRWRARSAACQPAFSRSADVMASIPLPPILREQTRRSDGLRRDSTLVGNDHVGVRARWTHPVGTIDDVARQLGTHLATGCSRGRVDKRR